MGSTTRTQTHLSFCSDRSMKLQFQLLGTITRLTSGLDKYLYQPPYQAQTLRNCVPLISRALLFSSRSNSVENMRDTFTRIRNPERSSSCDQILLILFVIFFFFYMYNFFSFDSQKEFSISLREENFKIYFEFSRVMETLVLIRGRKIRFFKENGYFYFIFYFNNSVFFFFNAVYRASCAHLATRFHRQNTIYLFRWQNNIYSRVL